MPPSQSGNAVIENEGNADEAADKGGSVGDASGRDRTTAANEPRVLRGTQGRDADTPGGTGGTGEGPNIPIEEAKHFDIIMGGTGGEGGSS
ncbi:hypothetical protein B0H16DRAFT_1889980 [Mycena metata]|uniref:Uncharacterized protein n=1 Tax=Mycena metata TaxID=1033252 RepID=A0AAD7IHR2_9AGAR|nr:hypothetical protein B0H16DRAFT_1889980 [Mycena metata]